MKKEYILIKNEKYKVTLSFEEIDFDYYTDVYVELFFYNQSIILFKDNLLALKNIIDQYHENSACLDIRLDEKMLGISLNDYYRGIYEEKIPDHLTLDWQGRWIGEKYCYFQVPEYATWIYRYDEKVILKVTPFFDRFAEDDYVQEYDKFIRKYNDVFREHVSSQQLENMKKIIYQLYNK